MNDEIQGGLVMTISRSRPFAFSVEHKKDKIFRRSPCGFARFRFAAPYLPSHKISFTAQCYFIRKIIKTRNTKRHDLLNKIPAKLPKFFPTLPLPKQGTPFKKIRVKKSHNFFRDQVHPESKDKWLI